MHKICEYCGNEADLVTGKDIYPQYPGLWNLWLWQCKPCKAHVGTHTNSKDHAALGRLANAELRKAKREAHAAFDPLWKNGQRSRKTAYKWLARKMGIDVNRCHIGWFDLDQCKMVVWIVNDHRITEP